MNNAVVLKTMDMSENMEILNLLQQKEKGMFQCHNQVITAKLFTENVLAI